jgi:hypothetical protein
VAETHACGGWGRRLRDHHRSRVLFFVRSHIALELDVDRASVRIGEHAFAPGADFALQAFAGELSTRTPVSAVYVGHGWVAAGVDP